MVATNNTDTNDTATLNMVLNPETPPSDGRCFWWKLPGELRDRVLKLIHSGGSNKATVVRSRRRWKEEQQREAKEAGRRDLPFTPSPFVPYVNHLLVNKQYAMEAYAVVMSSTTFDFATYTSDHLLGDLEDGESCKTFRNVTTIEIDFVNFDLRAPMIAKVIPRLKNVYFQAPDFTNSCGSESQARLIYETLTEADVLETEWLPKLQQVKGLSKVEFSAEEWIPTYSSHNAKRQQRAVQNVEMIKKVVAKALTRPVRKISDEDISSDFCDVLELMRQNPRGFAEWAVAVSGRSKNTV